VEDGILDFKGELIFLLIHSLHCLVIIGLAELPGIIMEVLVAYFPCFKGVSPHTFDHLCHDVASSNGQVGVKLANSTFPQVRDSAMVELVPSQA